MAGEFLRGRCVIEALAGVAARLLEASGVEVERGRPLLDLLLRLRQVLLEAGEDLPHLFLALRELAELVRERGGVEPSAVKALGLAAVAVARVALPLARHRGLHQRPPNGRQPAPRDPGLPPVTICSFA
jgi:hypothetical protein